MATSSDPAAAGPTGRAAAPPADGPASGSRAPPSAVRGRAAKVSAPVLVALLRRDRWVVAGCLSAAVALAWGSLVLAPGPGMPEMAGMAMPMPPAPWGPGRFAAVAAMWVAMMAAMMLPGAAPVLLLHATIARRRREGGGAASGAGLFALGYLLVWSTVAVGATALQAALDAGRLLSHAMALSSQALAGLLLLAAGLYQWSPLKQACLRQCRSPLEFLLAHWRDGPAGAVAMGLRHGLVCLGCCWALMGLLFVGGTMSLAWAAALAVVVAVEKAAPGGPWIGRALGVLLMLWGAGVIAGLAAAA